MKRIFLLLLVVALVLPVSIPAAMTGGGLPVDDASESETYEKVSPTTGIHKNDYLPDKEIVTATIFDNEFLASFGKIVVKDTIEYNGKSYDLYPVFENQKEAFNRFTSLYAGELEILEAKGAEFGMDKPDLNTKLSDYFGIAMENAQGAANGADSERWYQVIQFMDAYSGYSRNQRVFDFLSDARNRETMSDDEYETSLALLMPYTSELFLNYNNAKVNAASAE